MTEVERLAKIKVLKGLFKEYELLAKYNGGSDYDKYCALDTAIKVLKQEPKTGRWIDVDGDNAICSCCNRLNRMYGLYCKHCGAKMESEE